MVLFFCASPFQAKQSISADSGLVLLIPLQSEDGAPRETLESFKRLYNRLLIYLSFVTADACRCGFNCLTARLCDVLSTRWSTGGEEACFSDLRRTSAPGQQPCTCASVHALSVCLSAAALAPDLEEAGVRAERLISPEGSDK